MTSLKHLRMLVIPCEHEHDVEQFTPSVNLCFSWYGEKHLHVQLPGVEVSEVSADTKT